LAEFVIAGGFVTVGVDLLAMVVIGSGHGCGRYASLSPSVSLCIVDGR